MPPGPTPRLAVGRYQIVEEIGRGAMGVVYRGFDPVIGRAVALKTIAVGAMAEDAEEFRQRLFREASAAGALNHPNIVTIHDVVHESGTTAVAMEFVEGETLAATITRRAPLPLDEALTLIEQVCAGLDYAAAKGIVHRDIKPANILIGIDGRPRIADFGIARLASSNLTMTGAILGSVGYMSPEQVRGLPLDARSDLFAVATVFYETVTGHNPFGGTDAASTMYRIVHDVPAPLGELNPTLTSALDSVIGHALAKDPTQRFSSGAEFVRALRAVAAGAPAAHGLAGMTRVSPLRASARPAALIVGILGLMVAAGFAGALWLRPPAPAASSGTLHVTPDLTAPRAGGAARQAGVVEAPARPVLSPVPPRNETAQGRVDSSVGDTGRQELKGRAPAPESSQPRRGVGNVPRQAAPTAPAAPSGPGTLVLQFQGESFPVLIYDGDQQVTGDPLPLSPGPHRIRVVNDDVFLNRSYDTPSVRGGKEATVTVPGLGSAVANVRGENYAGVRVFVDERQLPLPYPAQIPRIAGGPHSVRFAWVSGTLAGKELKQMFEVRPGGHILLRAVPDDDQIVVQQIR